MKKIRVGMVGLGTIGSGVAEVLLSRRELLRKKCGIDIDLAVICDKDLKRARPVKIAKRLMTKSIGKVLYDPKIDIVVELIGGIHPARDMVMESLRQGKHVVTANKALLADSGEEIFDLANKLGLSVGFEASVGGGIPVIRALKEGFVSNRIELIYGIINGTSNFILSKMAEGGYDFNEALKLAQSKGYAERDPRLDISGGDSSHKMAVLAMLGFGAVPGKGDIYTEGIGEIEESDIAYADELGYSIKPLAIGKRSGDSVELRVHPTLIPKSHLLASIKGVHNAIFIKGDLIGENLFYGEGAGAYPTSSAVVSDIIAIARRAGDKIFSDGNIIPAGKDRASIKGIDDIRTRYYIRFSAIDKPGVLARISGVLGKYGISIASVTQKERKRAKIVHIVMMTHEARELDMARALKEIDSLKIIKSKTVRIRVEG